MISLSIDVTTIENARLIAPLGLSTPDAAPVALDIDGAEVRMVADPHSAQSVVCLASHADTVTLRWEFTRPGAPYPETLFQPRDSRFTRAATALAAEAREIASGAGGGLAGIAALANHVAGQFRYGHTEQKFYDGYDEIPQLCDLTLGSCVDINAYFIAACRGAGFEAGYVTGYFIPEEKRSHTTDMHCWVVTRHDGVVQEWDIAHHLKLGRTDIAPGLNPKPGVRVPMAHSMGLSFPALDVSDLKLLAEPMWLHADGSWSRADLRISLTGYDLLDRPTA